MAIKDAPIIEVPAVDDSEAYDENRPISSLIRTQLFHLHQAERIAVPEDKRTNTNINNLLTERQASDYIAAVTALLHHYGKSSTRAKNKPNKTTKKSEPANRKGKGSSAGTTNLPKTAAKSKKFASKSKKRG